VRRPHAREENSGVRGLPPLAACALLLLGAAAPVPASAPAPAAPAAFEASQSDPRAISLADLVMQSLGGARAWEATRYIHFAFAVEKAGKRLAYRTHLWDRYQGRLRYENRGKDGKSLVILLDLTTRHGSAYREGTKLGESTAKPLLEEAYEAWINDTYWLLMPYKMKDPGVHLQYAGEETRGGATYDRVLLSFDAVGLTPKDRYWADINRTTHLMDRWSYILQDDPPQAPPAAWEWKGWRRFGGILLAPEKVAVGKDGVRITHPILEVPSSVPDTAFERPDPLPEHLAP